MPIYAYKCGSCGHAKDVLQRVSDDPLTVCPACGAESFSKQVTAAGFQLKGSGWYATDFRGGSNAPAADKAGDKPAESTGGEKAADKPAETGTKSDSGTKTESAPAPKSDAPSASAGGCRPSCACH